MTDIIDVKVFPEEVVVLIRERSMMWYCNGEKAPDRIYKQIYRVVDGKIVLVDTIKGKHVPAYRVEEQFIFYEKGACRNCGSMEFDEDVCVKCRCVKE